MSKQLFLFVNILLIACLSSIATEIYAPSLAAIAGFMHAPIEKAQFSLTIFMVGLAFSQLIYGPVSEGFGRRKPLIAGLLIFLVGSLLCAFSTSITYLLAGRLIQGLGAGACSSLWRTIFRDVYQGDDLAKYGAWLSVVIIFFVPAVPVLGGYFQHYLGWQASFGFLILYCLLTLSLILFVFKETSIHHHSERLKLSFIKQTFKELLTSRIFMGYSLLVFFCYGAFFSWFAVGPVLLIKHIGLSPVEFGWVTFIISAGGMALASTINGKFIKRFGSKFLLRAGWIIMFISGCLLLLGQLFFGLNLFAILVPVFLFYFGVTFIWPNAFAGAFTPFGHIAGYAGTLYSFMQLGGGALIGSISAHLPANSQFPMAIIFITSPILAWVSYEILVNRKESKIL
ncbi:MAG: multidrug effflux MFS transporter [Tatlockia sp.]|nr:multidrug effflux MFS transporter [Tatlockia sp.]